MAAAIIDAQGDPDSPGQDTVSTPATNGIGANIFAVIASWSSQFGGNINTPTDDQGNTYVLDTLVGSLSGTGTGLWVCANPNTSASVVATITHSFVGGPLGIILITVSGGDTSDPIASCVGIANQLADSSGNIQLGSVTPSGTKLIASAFFANGSTSYTIGSSFTEVLDTTQASRVAGAAQKSSSSAEDPVITAGSFATVFGFNMVFNDSGGGGGFTGWNPLLSDQRNRMVIN